MFKIVMLILIICILSLSPIHSQAWVGYREVEVTDPAMGERSLHATL